jgi:DNA replication protein DnaC
MNQQPLRPPPNFCEVCHKQFEFVQNRDFNPEAAKSMPILLKSYWVVLSHPECEQKLERERAEELSRKENVERRQIAKRKLREYGLPKILTDKSFDNFHVSPPTTPALEAAKAWTYDPKGLLLVGPPGRGKSHILAALANKFTDMEMVVGFVNITDLLAVLREGYDNESHLERLRLFASKSIDILILDDLGASKPTEWAEEQIYTIIDTRLREKRPIFVSTNCSEDELKKQFHERIASRLHEACTWIEVGGPDYRLLTGHRFENKNVPESGPTRRKQGPLAPGWGGHQ